ncbi:XRE family transcriptional regulator [Rhizobium sp. TRM95111]|uniref:helix-turn-helix domain-containing protein n=1 Tax=Rhizobium alarense TaxID=2846851 RepID=UPI001F342CBF|nr:XRE family transcriptional regulator [Rhizobium alarense]MCF3640760.1 XRE family transcriptional regulator [Rhizobium alarense]
MIMENPEHAVDVEIAERLRSLRTAQSLTIDQLAERSGVSRAMISRVERGEASPTAQLLSRLCTALGETLSAFFAFGRTSGDPLSRRGDQPLWRDPETGYERRAVSPAGTVSRVEVVEVAFPPGGRAAFPPETAKEGMTQHIWLFAGMLEMTVAGTTHRLQAGDCLFMSITEGHVFHNPGEATAHYAVILDRGRS